MNLCPGDRCGIISGERATGDISNREKCTLENFLRGGNVHYGKIGYRLTEHSATLYGYGREEA